MSVTEPEALRPRVARLREHQWTPIRRATLIGVLSIVIGSLFVATYQLALGDPVPHRINAALIGDRSANARTVGAVERVAGGKLAFRSYESVAAALHAIDEQRVYAALDLTSSRPTLYVASAAGTSVAHVLEWIYAIDPLVRVVDTRPVASDDPNGLDIFYLMLVATIIGFFTVFTVRGMAGNLELRHHVSFVLILAGAGALVLTSVDGPPPTARRGYTPRSGGILALHLLAVASFASLMAVLIGRWAMVPTWLFFVILGNASSGGAVSPPLLPEPFAFLSKWLPSGATVTALRNAIYFRDYQHARPIVVLGVWAIGLFVVWLAVSQRRLRGAAPASATSPTSPLVSESRHDSAAASAATDSAPGQQGHEVGTSSGTRARKKAGLAVADGGESRKSPQARTLRLADGSVHRCSGR